MMADQYNINGARAQGGQAQAVLSPKALVKYPTE
jgi:hypothetical protein